MNRIASKYGMDDDFVATKSWMKRYANPGMLDKFLIWNDYFSDYINHEAECVSNILWMIGFRFGILDIGFVDNSAIEKSITKNIKRLYEELEIDQDDDIGTLQILDMIKKKIDKKMGIKIKYSKMQSSFYIGIPHDLFFFSHHPPQEKNGLPWINMSPSDGTE